MHSSSAHVKHPLSTLPPATKEEVQKLIRQSASKTCDLDPVPTWLVIKFLNGLLPTITKIVNLSLSTSDMSSVLRDALVAPLLKKTLLDPDIFKHFRPVSIFEFFV